jgi:hypothetical protein
MRVDVIGMIFAVAEDGTVKVLENEAVAQTWEPIDIESRAAVFSAEDGTWLEPRFTRPNRYRFFGLVLEQGAFELVRNTAGDPTIDPITVALDDAVALEPNPHFRTTDEIRQHVAARPAGPQERSPQQPPTFHPTGVPPLRRLPPP